MSFCLLRNNRCASTFLLTLLPVAASQEPWTRSVMPQTSTGWVDVVFGGRFGCLTLRFASTLVLCQLFCCEIRSLASLVQLFFSHFFFKRARNATDLHKKVSSDEFDWILCFKFHFCCRFYRCFAALLLFWCEATVALLRYSSHFFSLAISPTAGPFSTACVFQRAASKTTVLWEEHYFLLLLMSTAFDAVCAASSLFAFYHPSSFRQFSLIL